MLEHAGFFRGPDMRTKLYSLLLALTVALSALGRAFAQEVTSIDPADPVPGARDSTYLDLVRQFVPDIAATDNIYEGHQVIGMRHVNGDEMSGEAPETVAIHAISALPVQSDGKDRLLLLVDLGQSEDSVESFTVLALFSLADGPTLLDAANVGYDRFTGFGEPPELSLGEGKNVVITQSSHFNSNQNYEATPLILVRNDHLQFIDTVFTFDDRSCSYTRDQVAKFGAGDRDARTYPDIVATVTETTSPSGEDCGDEQPPKAGARSFRVTYRWDEAASKFVADSDAFERLAKENEERF